MATVLQISSGQGPQECRKFVVLLSKVIYQDAIKCNLHCNCLTQLPNKNDSLGSMRFVIEGENIESFKQSWNGTIKWIWQSTIRPNWPRKNWFVKVSFFDFETSENKAFNLSDIKIETCRASGNGGQHVNTTNSAVRVIHIPTGISAVASEERSQNRNKALALLRLQEKLHLISEQQKSSEKESMWIDHYHLERGGAIRVFKSLPLVEVK
jgi:peptide chain release factor